jgi:hypothetical protein
MELKELVTAAKEIQKVMDLDQDPPLTAKDPKKVEKWIKEAADLIDPEEDKFTDEVIDVFSSLGVWIDQMDDEDESPDEDEDESPDEDEDDNLVTQIENAAQLKDLKIIAKDLDEFKSLRSALTKYRTADSLRKVMLEMLNHEEDPPEEDSAKRAPAAKKETKKEKPAKKSKEPRGQSNQQLADQLLADEASEKEIIKAFTERYKDKDGADEDWIAKRAAIYMKIAERNAE